MRKTRLKSQPLTPPALYARVYSDRQDVDLSVSTQLRALKEYAKANGYSVAREYIDKAESGRVVDRPQFREMIEEGSKPKAPFEVILVWKFSRFTRKREHAVAFKAQLRRRASAWCQSPSRQRTTPPAGYLRASSRAWTNTTRKIWRRRSSGGCGRPHHVGSSSAPTLPTTIGRSRSTAERRSVPHWGLTRPPLL